jgi:hypothetical protein
MRILVIGGPPRSALLSEQGNPDPIRFMLRCFVGLRHDGYYIYAIAT